MSCVSWKVLSTAPDIRIPKSSMILIKRLMQMILILMSKMMTCSDVMVCQVDAFMQI